MNDKKDSFRGITDEEKEALFRGTFDHLQLSSFSEALQGKSSAFKAYLVIITLLMVFVFVASFAGSLLSIPSIANSTHPADVQIYKIRVFLGLFMVAAFYAQLLLRGEIFSMLVSYASLCVYLLGSGATRLLRLLPEPGLGFYMYVLAWVVAIILLLLFAREAAR